MKKVALVHDYLTQYGGAERVLAELCLMFPNAPIYTLFYDEKKTGRVFSDRVIYTSFLQKIPKIVYIYRFITFLMPISIEQFDLSNYDIVVSSSASFGKGVITREYTDHICYCHTPTRFLWGNYKNIMGTSLYPRFISWIVPIFLPYLRIWDNQRTKNIDYFICNSENIKNKIKRYYNRDSEVVYPPVNTNKFKIGIKKNYFLIVGRMLPYKKFDIAIDACNQLKIPLMVVGDGPEYKKLKNIAGPTIKFLGKVSDEKLVALYSHTKALIAPQEEDFGISSVESLASGSPVISYKAGGALEYIRDGENGIFFSNQNPDSLKEALLKFDKVNFDSEKIKRTADKFDRQNFHRKFLNIVSDVTFE